nr:hypothetical protein [Bacteroidota bacterium]
MISLFGKIYSVFLFLICINSICIAQPQKQNKVNPNGYNRFFYANGNLSSEGNMVNGKPEGYWRTYFENGNVKSEGNRKNNMLDSLWTFYFPDKKYRHNTFI